MGKTCCGWVEISVDGWWTGDRIKEQNKKGSSKITDIVRYALISGQKTLLMFVNSLNSWHPCVHQKLCDWPKISLMLHSGSLPLMIPDCNPGTGIRISLQALIRPRVDSWIRIEGWFWFQNHSGLSQTPAVPPAKVCVTMSVQGRPVCKQPGVT